MSTNKWILLLIVVEMVLHIGEIALIWHNIYIFTDLIFNLTERKKTMGILFGILLMLNLANPETRDFVNQTIENNKKYDCKFVYKGLSQPVNRPAATLYGYTIWQQRCETR